MPIINVEDFGAINKATIDRRKESIKPNYINEKKVLNQAGASCRPAHTWYIEIA